MSARWSGLLSALWQPPTQPVAWSSWLFVMLLAALATTLYWLSPGLERFESWLQLPPPPPLPRSWLPTLLLLRDSAPDFVWALLAGCCLRDLIWSLRLPVPAFCVIVAATGWELGQWLSLLPGYFDVVDLGLSVVAGGLALAVPAKGEPR